MSKPREVLPVCENNLMTFSQSDLLATILFWSGFAFSAGPFWTAIMAAATTNTFRQLYTDYMLYLIFGWLPLIAFIAAIVSWFGVLGGYFLLGMHIVGIFVVFWMAWKIYRSQPGIQGKFDFDWKAMSILSWTNPKVWLLIPIGSLNSHITGYAPVDILIYCLVGVPIFLTGLYFWGSVGRLGAKISLQYVNKANAMLMVVFGFYLIFSAVKLVT
jgi:hypothetical protein